MTFRNDTIGTTEVNASDAPLSVGVIGTGTIGTDHVYRLARTVAGARVHSVFDVDFGRASSVAHAAGAKAQRKAQHVIEDPEVDAVLVASPDPSHPEMVLASIGAAKPVLCEKPLAPSVGDCLEILAAEQGGRRLLVQVGFMRRYDEGFRFLKASVESTVIGQPVAAHCVHRNASSPPGYHSAMSFTSSVIHEIDAVRWILGEEITAVTVVRTRRSPLAPDGLRDPQIVLLESESGIVVDVEVFVNCQYGYDVRCELVGSVGAVSLEEPSSTTVSVAGMRRRVVAPDWRDRFAHAYRVEIQEWVNALRARPAVGAGDEPGCPADGGGARAVADGAPTAWDGYVATAVAEAAVTAMETGERTLVKLEPKPAFYP